MISPPAHSEQILVTFPAQHVLLITFNRPKSLNAMTPQMRSDLEAVLNWFEEESSLWVVIVTGAGRLFCAGADLKAWDSDQTTGRSSEQQDLQENKHGFASLSRRQSRKVIVAAVNGGAYGGGMEVVLNCDLVVTSEDAQFALPEVRRGVIASQGGIPRLSQIAGHQHAAEMLLLGLPVSASAAQQKYGFVNRIVPSSAVVESAIQLAQQIVANSPDAVQATKAGLTLPRTLGMNESVMKLNWSDETTRLYKGDNIKEGLRAFTQKRDPVWKNPAKL